MKYHFWWSEKMEALHIYMNPESVPRNLCALIDGVIVPYNICSSTKEHLCAWGDMQYLGYGIIWAVNGHPSQAQLEHKAAQEEKV